MRIAVTEEVPPDWVAYASVPIRFVARTVVEARPREPGGFDLHERSRAAPLEKDYDAIPGEHPTAWPGRFDVSRWGVLVARAGAQRAGGAVIVADAPGVDMLEGRVDLAVLWDIRVRPEFRGKGIGTQLFEAAEDWARRRGNAELKVETQDINPEACAFYARRGCELRAVDAGVYRGLPGEVQFLWYKPLGR